MTPKRKYYITACREAYSNKGVLIQITRLVIEAEDRADAERKSRELGYTPLGVQRFI